MARVTGIGGIFSRSAERIGSSRGRFGSLRGVLFNASWRGGQRPSSASKTPPCTTSHRGGSEERVLPFATGSSIRASVTCSQETCSRAPSSGECKHPCRCELRRDGPGIAASLRCARRSWSRPVLRAMREPSSHRGLLRPWLRSALRRGIAYPWGLASLEAGPGSIRMLASEPLSRLRLVA